MNLMFGDGKVGKDKRKIGQKYIYKNKKVPPLLGWIVRRVY